MLGFSSASTERISLENRMNAFMGRFGAPSARSGVRCGTRTGTSGGGLGDGVTRSVECSEVDGDGARSALDLIWRRTERRMSLDFALFTPVLMIVPVSEFGKR